MPSDRRAVTFCNGTPVPGAGKSGVRRAGPVGRAVTGSSGTFEVNGGASAFSGNAFCLFDPAACGAVGAGGAKNFSQILHALASQPRNDQLTATMIIGPAPGTPGSRPAITRHLRTVTQIVTGMLFIPVIVTR
jgi:hypothetical protein